MTCRRLALGSEKDLSQMLQSYGFSPLQKEDSECKFILQVFLELSRVHELVVTLSTFRLCYWYIHIFLRTPSFAFGHTRRLSFVHLHLISSNPSSRACELSENFDKVTDFHEMSRSQELLCGALLQRHLGTVDELQHCRKHLSCHAAQFIGRLADVSFLCEHDGEVLAACCQQGFVRLEVDVLNNKISRRWTEDEIGKLSRDLRFRREPRTADLHMP
ncbi:hypothetical protein INR49_013053 [Caranx melampygus]|nr:hypothetical protein INR49_013053 [Caranx melampygus]